MNLLRFGECFESKSFVIQKEIQGMDNTETLQYVLLKLKNMEKVLNFLNVLLLNTILE